MTKNIFRTTIIARDTHNTTNTTHQRNTMVRRFNQHCDTNPTRNGHLLCDISMKTRLHTHIKKLSHNAKINKKI